MTVLTTEHLIDADLKAFDDLGELGKAVFERIASGGEQGISGLFGAESLAFYSQRIGSTVRVNA